MTQARSSIVLPGQQAVYHCTNRCVRRAWLCGIDPDTKQNYEHRKALVEERIRQLGRIFSVAILSDAVMSKHLHVVLSVEPSLAAMWSDEEVIDRWLLLYPPRTPEPLNPKRAGLLGNPDPVARCRERLVDLSWFMRALDEYVARQANAEDGKNGRFWQGRFKCQLLMDEASVTASMVYVDLNPVRAGMAANLKT
jgi:REP element-mobilizing transposase RayT